MCLPFGIAIFPWHCLTSYWIWFRALPIWHVVSSLFLMAYAHYSGQYAFIKSTMVFTVDPVFGPFCNILSNISVRATLQWVKSIWIYWRSISCLIRCKCPGVFSVALRTKILESLTWNPPSSCRRGHACAGTHMAQDIHSPGGCHKSWCANTAEYHASSRRFVVLTHI